MPQRKIGEVEKILFKGALDNLIFLKRQQWTITNYVLLTYAAVFALTRGATGEEKSFLTALAVITLIYGLHCVHHTQQSMTKYYNNVFDIDQKFLTAKERHAYKRMKERPDYSYNGQFIFGLMAANGIAFVIIFYLIWWKPELTPFGTILPKCV